MLIEVNDEHPKKVPSLMEEMLLGRLMLSNEEQFLNAYAPIELTPLGMETETISSQL